MVKNKLLVLFNHSISVSPHGFSLLYPEVAFLEGTGKQFSAVDFAGFWEQNNLSLGSLSRNFSASINFVKLGIFRNSANLVVKLLNYLSAIWQVHRLVGGFPRGVSR